MIGEFNGVLGLLVLIADIWAIVSVFQSRTPNLLKLLWIILIVVLPLVGVIIWAFVGPGGPFSSRGGRRRRRRRRR